MWIHRTFVILHIRQVLPRSESVESMGQISEPINSGFAEGEAIHPCPYLINPWLRSLPPPIYSVHSTMTGHFRFTRFLMSNQDNTEASGRQLALASRPTSAERISMDAACECQEFGPRREGRGARRSHLARLPFCCRFGMERCSSPPESSRFGDQLCRVNAQCNFPHSIT
jgi:hypothetical protein